MLAPGVCITMSAPAHQGLGLIVFDPLWWSSMSPAQICRPALPIAVLPTALPPLTVKRTLLAVALTPVHIRHGDRDCVRAGQGERVRHVAGGGVHRHRRCDVAEVERDRLSGSGGPSGCSGSYDSEPRECREWEQRPRTQPNVKTQVELRVPHLW